MLQALLFTLPLVFGTTTPDEGSVLSVEAKTKQMVLLVNDVKHTVSADDVELLLSDGKAAKLSDFTSDAKVTVTFEKKRITRVQLQGDGDILDTTLLGDEGSVVKVVKDANQIVLRVGEDEHTVIAADVKLLRSDGTTATLKDFKAGAKVKVTFEEGKITKVQLSS